MCDTEHTHSCEILRVQTNMTQHLSTLSKSLSISESVSAIALSKQNAFLQLSDEKFCQ